MHHELHGRRLAGGHAANIEHGLLDRRGEGMGESVGHPGQ
jgi:hypothetical protein